MLSRDLSRSATKLILCADISTCPYKNLHSREISPACGPMQRCQAGCSGNIVSRSGREQEFNHFCAAARGGAMKRSFCSGVGAIDVVTSGNQLLGALDVPNPSRSMKLSFSSTFPCVTRHER